MQTRLRIARVDENGMQSRQVGAAAHPLPPLWMVPQRAHDLPAIAAVRRLEKAARKRSAPEHARLIGAARLQRPNARRAPLERPVPHVEFFVAFGLRRIGRRGDLAPCAVAVGAMHLDAEVAVIERRVALARAGIGHRERDVVAEEIGARDLPCLRPARHRRTTLSASRREVRRSFVTLPRAPDRHRSATRRRPDRLSPCGRGSIRPSRKIVMCLRSAD